MRRCVYVNGRYVHPAQAQVSVEDRGYQFADGVYEVIAILDGIVLDMTAHFDRLEESLAALRIPAPVSRRVLMMIVDEVILRNDLRTGLVYIQVTRGVAPRNHLPSSCDGPPALVVAANVMPALPAAPGGIMVRTVPDLRWARCDIKSIALLPNCLAKEDARRAGCQEAWQIDREGYITEGASSNAWILTPDHRLLTRPLSPAILSGVTRKTVLDIALQEGLTVEERPFTVAEAHAAAEAYASSASLFLAPVLRIDGQPVGTGAPGPYAARLLARYVARIGEAA